MRLSPLAAALALSAAVAAAPLVGAQAADGFTTDLYVKTALGPQRVVEDTPLGGGDQLRLVVTAAEDLTVTVSWQPSGGDGQMLAQDVALASGETLVVPGAEDWIELGAGQGREAFLVSAKTKDGQTIEQQVAYIILGEAVAELDQQSFAAFSKSKAKGGAEPLSGFSSFATGSFTGNKTTGFAEQLSKVPPEPPTFSSEGASLFRRLADGVVLVLTNEGLGTGSVLDANGTIITNWHVVKGYQTVGVVFRPPQGTPLSEDMIVLADVVKIGESSDLALLVLHEAPANPTIIELGDIATVEVGDDVHAIGHPQGESWTYTRGYVSQIRDNYEWDIGNGPHKAQIIQTQTPINPGNSGGPLFDKDGKMIGVNSFLNLDSEGLNYAISVSEVGKFLATEVAEAPTQPAQPVQPGQPAQPPGNNPQPMAPQPSQPAQPSQPSQPRAEAEPEFFPLDTDGNGKIDAYGADRNGDGYYDIVIVDENEDGIVDYALFDDNFNGVPDAKLVPTADAQGPFDVWIFDENEDGVADYYGLDWNQDGTIDEYRQA